MQITKQTANGAIILTLSGEIDLHASPVLRGELQDCLAKKISLLLLDFKDVNYIDSSGMATLIEYMRESNAFKGKLALFGLQKRVRTIFDLVRLNELFVITDTADEALGKLAVK